MAVSPAFPAAGPLALGWAVMLVAMMLPGMAAPVRHVQHRSLAVRRVRATALFLGGYAAIWMAAGAVLVAAALALQSQALGAAVVLLAVVLWQFSPFKQVCLNRLHGHPPLAAFGAAADRDVFVFGLKHGVWCVGSCSGLMILPMSFPAAHLALMLLVSVWIWAEQLERAEPPSFRVRVPLKAARILLAQLKLRSAGATHRSAESTRGS
jgi:predicted metal-binding membrane protein